MDELDLGATIKGFSPGQMVLGRYVLKKLVGRGGMGVVWLAHDEELERDLALKFLPEIVALDREAIRDLKRETRRSLQLTHPHIIRIYDFVQDARTAAIAMEYVDGDTLAARKLDQEPGHFEVAQVRTWVQELLEALEYAHKRAQVVHRDLKPANLMVDGQGFLKVADFGIAASVSDSVSRVSAQAGSSGTPLYMSPQQMLGEPPSVTDDVYAFGATVYELLTGKPPFYSGNVLLQVREKVAPRMAGRRQELGRAGEPIPEEWERTVAACLAKEAKDRPQSAAEVGARLSGSVAGVTAPARPAIAPVALSSPPESSANRGKLAAGIALATIAAAVAWYFGIHRPEIARRREQAEVFASEMTSGHAALQDKLARENDDYARMMREIENFVDGASDAERRGVEAAVAKYLPSAPENYRAAVQARWRDRLAGWQAAETERTAPLAAPASGKAWTIPGLDLELRPVSAGTFRMGSLEGGGDDERPVTRVSFAKPFWLGKTEVTQAQWEQLMGNNPSNFKGADRPVEQVSWNEAMEFCQKLTERERRAGRVPAGYIYTLPTEAQWEYACRAGATGDFSGKLEDMGWYEQNSRQQTHPVGRKAANSWGLHDMHGNVWEWCFDWYGNYSGSSVTDPKGAAAGPNRVYRGGGWFDSPANVRSAFRNGSTPNLRWNFLGFRVALVAQGGG